MKISLINISVKFTPVNPGLVYATIKSFDATKIPNIYCTFDPENFRPNEMIGTLTYQLRILPILITTTYYISPFFEYLLSMILKLSDQNETIYRKIV